MLSFRKYELCSNNTSRRMFWSSGRSPVSKYDMRCLYHASSLCAFSKFDLDHSFSDVWTNDSVLCFIDAVILKHLGCLTMRGTGVISVGRVRQLLAPFESKISTDDGSSSKSQ